MRCIFLKILIVSVLLNLLIMPLNTSLAAMCGYISLLSTVLLPVELLWYKKNYIDKKQFTIIAIFAVIVLFNSRKSFLNLRRSEVENVIKAVVSFFTFLIALSVGNIQYSQKDLRFYFFVVRLFAIILILYTIIPFDFQYSIVNEYGNRQFTLSMGNPNATATKIIFCIILLCIENRILKNKYLKGFNLLLIVGLFYVIWMLQSRTALFCSLIYIIYSVALKLEVQKWMMNVVWSIPLLFIPLQLFFAENSDFEILGKSLASGRQEIFSDFFDLISASPFRFILGDFIENQLSNGHNIYFTIIFNFGFIGLILFILFWNNENKTFKECTVIANDARMAWIVFVIHAMAEAAVLSGAFTFSVILILLNRMTKDKILENPKESLRYDFFAKKRAKGYFR